MARRRTPPAPQSVTRRSAPPAAAEISARLGTLPSDVSKESPDDRRRLDRAFSGGLMTSAFYFREIGRAAALPPDSLVWDVVPQAFELAVHGERMRQGRRAGGAAWQRVVRDLVAREPHAPFEKIWDRAKSLADQGDEIIHEIITVDPHCEDIIGGCRPGYHLH